MRNTLFIMAVLCLPFLMACGDDDATISPEEQRQIDLEKISQYVTENNLSVVVKDDVSIATTQAGSGAKPTLDNNVQVRYTGKLLDGTIFDSSTDPVTFQLGRLIPGWQIGIPCMQEKESATLLIPSYLGYGSQSVGSIPANSVLIFDITLDSVITN